MKKIISCFVLFTVVLSTFSIAFANTPDSFKMGDDITATYSADQSILTVEGSGKMWDYTDETCIDNQLTKKIIIKEGIENISDYAFSSFAFVNEISLPEGLESIGKAALQYTQISELALPDSITHIGAYAFSGSINLTEITLPENLTFIGEGVFAFCESLTTATVLGNDKIQGLASAFDLCEELKSFTVASDNPYYACVDGVLYTKSGATLVKYPNGKSAKDFTVPSGVKVIGDYAFAETELEKINLNDGLTNIGSYAFYASSIESIVLPDTVTSIGAYAFSECFDAKKLVLPKRLKTIKQSVFMGVDAKSISIPNSVTYIGKNAFANCSKLESITLPKKLKTIKPDAFNNCESLSLVNLGSSLAQGIGEAFRECNSIKKFKVSKTNKKYSVKKGVLFNKSLSRLVKYPAKKSSKSYIVPSSVKVIDKYAFSGCLKLKNVTLPKKLKKIYNNAFETTAISKIDLPEKLTYIGANAFSGSRLKSITFNKSLKTIGKDAFFACDSLKTVNLGICKTSSNIGLALRSTDGLKQFKVSKKNSKFSVKDGVLFNKKGTKLIMYPVGKSSKKYTIPRKVSSIGDYAFYCAYKLNKITLPEKLKTIGSSSFFATGATKITIPASVTKIGRRAFCASDNGNLKITMLCKKAPEISKQSFVNVSDGSDCIIYVKSKSVKTDLQKQFNSKNIESKIIVK